MEKLLLSKVLKQMFEVVPKSYTLKNQGTDVSNYNTFDQYGHMVNSVNFLLLHQPPPPKKLFKLPYPSGINFKYV